ncbi:MAG TPA: hypothetical protein VES91_03320 [Burkholderiaceae bacterium]|nr:hypothetical protein [Burkholderiaceae bacterium]
MGEAFGNRRVKSLAVGFDFELNAGFPERLGDSEKVRNDERFAAAEHDVGDFVPHDLARDFKRLVCIEFSGQPLSGRRLGAAVKAREIAVARELPCDEQRRPKTVDAIRHWMYRPA